MILSLLTQLILGALCEKRNLANIPSQLPQDTQVLDMNGNSLNQLAPHIFQDKRLNNLQKIYLSECKISFIADDAFSHLTNLIELDLSHNHLQHVPVKSFEQLNHSLRKLSLAYNQIQTIEPDSFASISHLTNLDLSNNQLSQLKVNAFAGLNQLKELKLHDNRLTQLPINIVEVFPDYLLLDLFSNPWHCDCELRQSIDYLTRHHVQQSIQPSCSTPTRHKDIRWPNVRSDEFLCPPVVINKQNELVVGAGSNVSLACTARGSSPLTFVWFQDEKNMTSPKPNNHSDSAPSSTKLLEERRYEIAEELGPISQPNITTSVLYLFNLELTDTSMFFCWVENAAGYTMANYSLIVNDSPPAQLTPSGFSNGGIFRSFWLSLGETQMGLLSIAFIILLTAAIIFLLMFKQSNRSSKSSQSSDMKQSKGHQHNMPQIETISSSNKFSSVNNQHLTDTDDEEDDDDDDDDDDTDRSSSGSGNSCRKNLKVIAASDLDGFIEHMRSGIINMDYHSMSPVIQFNNASKDKRSQEQQQQQRQQSMIDQQHHHHYHQQLAQQQHLNHQQQPPYLDSTSQVNLNPHHLHHHHFQSASNASSIPYYSQNNINGSTSMATTTSDLSPASSSVSNTNFAQPAPITNCDLQQHQLTDPSMVAPATNTTTTSYTSDYQSGYSEDPSLASNMMPPMYYETLDPASYHPTAGNLYNGALIIGQTSSATGTLLRHPQQQQQQQQQLLLQDMAHNGRTIQNGSQRIQMDSRFRIL